MNEARYLPYPDDRHPRATAGCAVLVVTLGPLALAMWLWSLDVTFWTVLAAFLGVFAVAAAVHGWRYCKAAWQGSDMVFMAYVVVLGLLGWGVWWWYHPERLPWGNWMVTESRGFGNDLRNAVFTMQKSGHSYALTLAGPSFRRVEWKTRWVRRSFSGECALVFASGEGTAFCSYDPALKMWRIEWQGLGQERWMLIKNR